MSLFTKQTNTIFLKEDSETVKYIEKLKALQAIASGKIKEIRLLIQDGWMIFVQKTEVGKTDEQKNWL